jgi:hypothetical protein
MTTWHVDAHDLATYRNGRIGNTRAASIETHLITCATCRTLVATTADSADGDRLDRVWREIVDVAEAPAPRVVERLLRLLGTRPDTARLLAATPSLRLSWITGVAIVLAMAAASSHTGRYGLALFLALAPVLPVAGVAASFGPAVDPTYEVTLASPYSSTRLLLLRSLAVVLTTLMLTAAGAALLPEQRAAAAWLLPALGLTAGTLALSAWIEPLRAGIAMATLWFAVTIPALRPGEHPLLATALSVQIVSGTVFVVALIVVLNRRVDLGGGARSRT